MLKTVDGMAPIDAVTAAIDRILSPAAKAKPAARKAKSRTKAKAKAKSPRPVPEPPRRPQVRRPLPKAGKRGERPAVAAGAKNKAGQRKSA